MTLKKNQSLFSVFIIKANDRCRIQLGNRFQLLCFTKTLLTQMRTDKIHI